MNRLYIVWMAFYYTLLAILDHSHMVCWTYTCMHNYRVAGRFKGENFCEFRGHAQMVCTSPSGLWLIQIFVLCTMQMYACMQVVNFQKAPTVWYRYLYYANVCMQVVNFQKAPTVWCRHLYYANVCMQVVNFQKAPTVYLLLHLYLAIYIQKTFSVEVGDLDYSCRDPTSQCDSLFRTS